VLAGRYPIPRCSTERSVQKAECNTSLASYYKVGSRFSPRSSPRSEDTGVSNTENTPSPFPSDVSLMFFPNREDVTDNQPVEQHKQILKQRLHRQIH
jgi:hypothetical protein